MYMFLFNLTERTTWAMFGLPQLVDNLAYFSSFLKSSCLANQKVADKLVF